VCGVIGLPASASTFKRAFLGGDGQIEIHSDQDGWTPLFRGDAPFTNKVDRVADVKFSLGTSREMTLGGPGSLKLGLSGSVGAMHQIQLIWADAPVEPGLTRGLKPGENDVLVRLLFQGKADASAKGSAPVGPLAATFGVTAGGSMTYELLQLRPAATPARTILGELFGRLRLPQQVTDIDSIPTPGEVIATRFSGYLTLNGQLNYGYSMTGSREIEVGKLNLDLDYALRLAAGLTAAYSLAGEFDIEARAGSSPGFVRFVVHKSRDASFNFAADFGAVAEVHLKGLPNTADEFLIKAFGAHVERGVTLFAKARKYSSVEELEKAAGKLLKGAIHEWSPRLTGKALSNGTLNEYLSKALEVIDEYNNVDQRLIHLYEDFLDKRVGNLTDILDRLAKAGSADELKELAGAEGWDLIKRLAGTQLYDILLDPAAFTAFSGLVRQAKELVASPGRQAIRDLVQSFKGSFPLDSVLKQLNGIKTPQDLANLADEKLQGVAEQLLGKAFEQIRADAGKDLAELRAALEKVDSFKQKYYEKLKDVTRRSFESQLHFAFARASASEELLDVEVDVSTAEGGALAARAAGGDFAELLARFDSKLVRIHKGVFTHSMSTSTHIQVNLFGYGAEGLTQVLQNTEEALEAHDGGLLHIYTTKTQIDERKKHGGELTASTFLIATTATALQPEGSREFLIRTLPKMSAQYELLKEDDKTKPEEMRQILDLATLTGILPNREAFLDELRTEFPSGLGKVSARYVVRYGGDAVAAAFHLDDGPKREALRAVASGAMRTFIGARYIGMRPTDAAATLGFAYLDPRTFDLFRELGSGAAFANSRMTVTLPGWFTKGGPQRVELSAPIKQVLFTLFSIEREFIKRLATLDETIDALRDGLRGVSSDELNRQVRKFIEMSDDLNDFRENAFFAIFDRLAMAGSGGKALRQSALVLEITPAGGQKVTKVLTAAAQRPEIAASDEAGAVRVAAAK
jgi:hypothetical protein